MKSFVISIVLLGLVATSFGLEKGTTTEEPSNATTTSESPSSTTTTTARSTTTKSMTTTTVLSTTTAATGTPKYAATKGNVTCLILQSDVSTTFTYMGNLTNSSVPRDPEIISFCGESTDEINFYWDVDTEVEKSLRLRYTKSDKQYSLSYVEFIYTGNLGKNGFYNASLDSQLQTNLGSSYKCDSGVTIKVGDMTLVMNNLVSNAFINTTDSSPDFQATGNDCSYNGKTDAIVPIAVGAALAAMVVIVLIGYCIGRRRASPGYQSMTNA